METAPADATTFWVKIYFKPYQGPSPDSLLTQLTAGGTGSVLAVHRLPGLTVRDSFSQPRPPAGTSVTVAACGSYKRGSQQTAYICRGATYVEPPPPLVPPVIDSVTAKDTVLVSARFIPASLAPIATLGVGQSAQSCPEYVVGTRTHRRGIPSVLHAPCAAHLAAIPDTARVVATQQAMIDAAWTCCQVTARNPVPAGITVSASGLVTRTAPGGGNLTLDLHIPIGGGAGLGHNGWPLGMAGAWFLTLAMYRRRA